MFDKVSTPGRLTVMIPTVKSKDMLRLEELHKEGREFVHNILVRKGMKKLLSRNGKMKPTAQVIFSKNMARLRANEDPTLIVRDLESQLQLL